MQHKFSVSFFSTAAIIMEYIRNTWIFSQTHTLFLSMEEKKVEKECEFLFFVLVFSEIYNLRIFFCVFYVHCISYVIQTCLYFTLYQHIATCIGLSLWQRKNGENSSKIKNKNEKSLSEAREKQPHWFMSVTKYQTIHSVSFVQFFFVLSFYFVLFAVQANKYTVYANSSKRKRNKATECACEISNIEFF